MKKFLCLVSCLLVCATAVLGGCGVFGSGSNVEVTVNNTYNQMTDEQWREYVDKLGESGADKQQAAIAGSMLSGVSILARFEYKEFGYKDGSSGFFGSESSTRVQATYHQIYCGAGVIVELDKAKGDAYVLTNCHVVYDDSSTEKITNDLYLYLYGQDTEGSNYKVNGSYLTNGNRYVYDSKGENLTDYYISDDESYRINAEVVGASVVYDLALLKISGSTVLKNSGAMKAEFVNDDDVYAGQKVYAVGNPEGSGMAVTTGVISKDSEEILLNLSTKYDTDDYYKTYRVMRTDAAINGGNSGGGLYNSDGKLVGIVNSKSVSEEIDNMGYALPASYARRLWKLMKDAYESGNSGFKKSDPYVSRTVFPAEYSSTGDTAFLNAQGNVQIAQVVTVTKAGGGFNVGDVLKHVTIYNGETVAEDMDITRAYNVDDVLLSARNGYTVTFTVLRGNVEQKVSFAATVKAYK